MGHSFGGITVFGAAKNCKQAKAIVGFDPWFFPHKNDEIGAAEHQKLFIAMNSTFPINV